MQVRTLASRVAIFKLSYKRFASLHIKQQSSCFTPLTSSLSTCYKKEQILNSFNNGFIKNMFKGFINSAAEEKASIKVSQDKRLVILSEANGETSNFHALWLRHNCQCSECKQPYSGQKAITVAQLKKSYTVESVRVDSEEFVHILWNEENHPSCFPLTFLRENRYSDGALRRQKSNSSLAVENTASVLPKIKYEALLDEEGVFQWMNMINLHGLCLIQGVPLSDGMVRNVAELMWPIQHTIYGSVWDVKSDPRPINIAYSDVKLDFHMDLAYYESPPGIQFLHCMRFDDCIEGGDSLFVDAWHAAETLCAKHREDFEILTRIPVTFQKIHSDRDHPVHMTYRRPHIVVTPDDQIVGVFWAPAFEGPLQIKEDLVEHYYRAYHRFATLIDSSPTKISFRLVPGDLISFNNRRILHARSEFHLNDGIRHLQGCYMNIDEYQSRLEVLSRRNGRQRPVKHTLNQSWL